jgi:coenzyme F420-0:L-glutamate ligase / coenzyme F420-1:gamma-L-glutamate ligase
VSEGPIPGNPVLPAPGQARWPLAARRIAGRITAGDYAPGDMLPARDLATALRVSRPTIARALRELRELGYVRREGRAHYVADAPPAGEEAPPALPAGATTGGGPGAAPAGGQLTREHARLLDLLARHPGGLTYPRAAALLGIGGLDGGPGPRRRALKAAGNLMRALGRAGLAQPAEARPSGMPGRPPTVWAITGQGQAAAARGWPALALADRPAGDGRARRKPAARWDALYRALPGIPLIGPGDDLSSVIAGAAVADGLELQDGDVVVVAQKVVSKAEGRIVPLAGVVAGPQAEELAGVLAIQDRPGLACTGVGAGRSDVAALAEERAILLPADPDASARGIRARLRDLTGARVAVIVSDSAGGPVREGAAGAASGIAGISRCEQPESEAGPFGNASPPVMNRVCEIAAAAAILMGQGLPVVIARGVPYTVDEGAASIAGLPIRPPAGEGYDAAGRADGTAAVR